MIDIWQSAGWGWGILLGARRKREKGPICLTPGVKLTLIMDFQEMWGSWVRTKGSGRVLGTELRGHFPLGCPMGIGGGTSSPQLSD